MNIRENVSVQNANTAAATGCFSLHGINDFACEMLQILDGGKIDTRKIWISTEAHLYQMTLLKNRISDSESLCVFDTLSLYPKKITLWAT